MEAVLFGALATLNLLLKVNTLVWVSFLVELGMYTYVNVYIVIIALLCLFPPRHGVIMIVGVLLAYFYGRVSYYNGAEYDGRWRNNTLRSLRVWRLFHLYFGFEISTLVGVRTTTRRQGALFAAYPHGLCPVSVMLAAMFPGGTHSVDVVLAVSYLFFGIPVVRELCLIFGCVSADKKALIQLLSTQKLNVVLLPGGAKEQCGLEKDTHIGFLKLGWDLQVDVYPIFLCGEDKVFYVFNVFPRLRKLTVRLVGYPLPSFFVGPLPVKLKACICRAVRPTDYENIEMFIKTFYRRLSRTRKQTDNACYFFPKKQRQYHVSKEPTISETWFNITDFVKNRIKRW